MVTLIACVRMVYADGLSAPGCACAGAAERALDMQAPAPAEAASLQAPLAALRARLAALLADWPGHPVLSQLDAIAERLLGALQGLDCTVLTCTYCLL